jgi:hypothetical protein
MALQKLRLHQITTSRSPLSNLRSGLRRGRLG